jgi:hypothetical protein
MQRRQALGLWAIDGSESSQPLAHKPYPTRKAESGSFIFGTCSRIDESMDELLPVRPKNNVPMRLHNMDQSTYNDPRLTCCTAPWGPTVEEEVSLLCTCYAFLN